MRRNIKPSMIPIVTNLEVSGWKNHKSHCLINNPIILIWLAKITHIVH